MANNNPSPAMIAVTVLSMVLDMGWKVYIETTKNMSPAELDAFINNKEQSVADTLAELDAKYGTP
jgi:hypothetical protein